MSVKKVIGCIPARFGAQRLPGKPLALIAGKPMILHVVERVKQAKSLTEVVVLTEDERILNVVRAAGFQAEMTSPDCQSGTDRIIEYAKNRDADFFVNIQGDEVFIAPQEIDFLVESFAKTSPQALGTLVYPLEPAKASVPSMVKVVKNAKDDALYFSRNMIPVDQQGNPPALIWCHIGLYIFTPETLSTLSTLPMSPLESIERLEQLRALEHGIPIKAFSLSHHEGYGVDTQADLERASAYFETEKCQPI